MKPAVARNQVDRDGTEVVFLGVRSGCFVAADLASKAGGRSVLWQPFVSGNRFLRELKLKEQIRSGLTGKRDGSSILLNGEKMPDELRNELSEREALFSASGNTLIIQISSTQKIIPQYKKLESEAEVKQVSIPPFWNPHEHWDCSAIIDMTVKLITGEENG